jgi:excisionase family DNA binding protein
MEASSQYVSVREAAQMTGASEKALRRRIERGTLASVRDGDQRLIDVADLVRADLLFDADAAAPGAAPATRPPAPVDFATEARIGAMLDLILHQAAAIRELTERVERLERR